MTKFMLKRVSVDVDFITCQNEVTKTIQEEGHGEAMKSQLYLLETCCMNITVFNTKIDSVVISRFVPNASMATVVFLLSANNSELVERLEGVVSAWTNKIKLVLTESEQMRKEADDVGPSAELEHWKRRMVTFHRWTLVSEDTSFLSDLQPNNLMSECLSRTLRS